MLLLANFALFQVAWLSSVIGGAQEMPWLGPVAVLVALAVHLYFARKPFEEVILVLLCALIGTSQLFLRERRAMRGLGEDR